MAHALPHHSARRPAIAHHRREETYRSGNDSSCHQYGSKSVATHPCIPLFLLLGIGCIIFQKKIVQRTQRTVFFHLVHRGDFIIGHAEFDEAIPTVKLMGSDFPDIFRSTVRTGTPHVATSLHAFRHIMLHGNRHDQSVLSVSDLFRTFEDLSTFHHIG